MMIALVLVVLSHSRRSVVVIVSVVDIAVVFLERSQLFGLMVIYCLRQLRVWPLVTHPKFLGCSQKVCILKFYAGEAHTLILFFQV